MVYSVSNWLTSRPPTIAIPSGRRSSEPVPVPSASGNPPSSAAIVVIMIGRKRSRQASIDGIVGGLAALALRLEREVDHHDGVFLDDADQKNDADQRDDVQIDTADQQGQDRADTRRRQRRKNRDRMDVALIEDSRARYRR